MRGKLRQLLMRRRELVAEAIVLAVLILVRILTILDGTAALIHRCRPGRGRTAGSGSNATAAATSRSETAAATAGTAVTAAVSGTGTTAVLFAAVAAAASVFISFVAGI